MRAPTEEGHREARDDRQGEALRVVPPGVREHEGEEVSDTRVEKSRWHSDESRTLKEIRAATRTTRSSLFGAMCALATFGRLTMVEACTRNESNLGTVFWTDPQHLALGGTRCDHLPKTTV